MKTIKQYLEEQLDRYDEKKSTAVQVVEELPADIQNRVYITEDDRVYAKDIELQQADSAVLTVNEQEMDENQNITVDGSNTKATYEEETDFIDNLLPKVGAIKEVDELPASPDKRVYITEDEEGNRKVYAKDIELQRADSAVLTVNEAEPDENQNITVDGDNINVVYEEEEDTLNNTLPKVGGIKEVEELPAEPDKRVYIDKDKRVYAKDVELQTVDTAVQVNWITEEEWEAIAVKKDNHFYVVS